MNGADVAQFETAVRPAMGHRVDLILKNHSHHAVDKVPAEDRRKIEAAVPNRLLVKPKKTRKLLVIDLCPAGGYYHTTIAFENLTLQTMAGKTGAFEPIFDNNLDT